VRLNNCKKCKTSGLFPNMAVKNKWKCKYEPNFGWLEVTAFPFMET